jgi:riboflavin kinase/FMN adenylyltransferase
LSGEDFIGSLAAACRPLRQISVGSEWSFGHRGLGDIHLLHELGAKHGFRVCGVAPVSVDGEVVSSTAVREAVREGNLARAAALLGREYTVLGTVIEGEHLGRKLGFPTANLTVHNEQLPPSGVYLVKALLGKKTLHGVGNLGFRPTVTRGEPKRMLEIHLLDHHADIYGAELEVFFLKYLRPETKFENVHALRAQIESDVATAKGFLGSQ